MLPFILRFRAKANKTATKNIEASVNFNKVLSRHRRLKGLRGLSVQFVAAECLPVLSILECNLSNATFDSLLFFSFVICTINLFIFQRVNYEAFMPNGS